MKPAPRWPQPFPTFRVNLSADAYNAFDRLIEAFRSRDDLTIRETFEDLERLEAEGGTFDEYEGEDPHFPEPAVCRQAIRNARANWSTQQYARAVFELTTDLLVRSKEAVREAYHFPQFNGFEHVVSGHTKRRRAG